MTLALTTPRFAIIAADTRFKWPDRVRDFGNKVRRVPQGWVAATGNTTIGLHALREIEATGLLDFDRLLPTIREVYEAATSYAASAGHDTPHSSFETFFVAVRHDAKGFQCRCVFASDGKVVDRPHTRSGACSSVIAWPPGCDIPWATKANRVHQPSIEASRSPTEALRRIASAFRVGYAVGRSMSEELEAGLTIGLPGGEVRRRHLRRPAAWVECASDSELEAALSDPPTLPPFPLLDAEVEVFGPPTELLSGAAA